MLDILQIDVRQQINQQQQACESLLFAINGDL